MFYHLNMALMSIQNHELLRTQMLQFSFLLLEITTYCHNCRTKEIWIWGEMIFSSSCMVLKMLSIELKKHEHDLRLVRIAESWALPCPNLYSYFTEAHTLQFKGHTVSSMCKVDFCWLWGVSLCCAGQQGYLQFRHGTLARQQFVL